MTLEEAIEHCKEKILEQSESQCFKCMEDHIQLMEWLKELKQLRKEKTELIRDLGHFL